MDTLPLTRNPVPKDGPRNLTVSLAAWLRQLGFAVLEQGGLTPTGLEASWRAPDGLLYQASYSYAPERATFQLLSCPGHQATAATYKGLVVRAEVNRLREVRFLLLSNTFYKDARQAALDAGLLRPTYAPHTD